MQIGTHDAEVVFELLNSCSTIISKFRSKSPLKKLTNLNLSVRRSQGYCSWLGCLGIKVFEDIGWNEQ